MFKAPRKHGYPEFPAQERRTPVFLGMLFGCGLALSGKQRRGGIAAYLLLWALSYAVIYTGTCRNCVYYGVRCPIPLEGSVVHRFCAKGSGRYGYASLFWASVAYVLRVMLPIGIMLRHRMIRTGTLYSGLLGAFWINHLFIEGCPHCINTACPLNPDH